MPSTVAPARRASWTAIDPTPPAAAETATVSPAPAPTARIVATAVTPVSQAPYAACPRAAAAVQTAATWSARCSAVTASVAAL